MVLFLETGDPIKLIIDPYIALEREHVHHHGDNLRVDETPLQWRPIRPKITVIT
jgi:hypothetical protein